jgi:molybdate transport system substrate-binding protein
MKALALAALAAAFLAACSSTAATQQASSTPSVAGSAPPSASARAEEVDLTVFAAASLSGVLEEVKPAYESTHPGTTLTVSTDSSAALEAKIEQGAAADVFLSADTANPQKLVQKGLSAGEPVVFAVNRLAIVVASGNPGGIGTPADLAGPGVKVIAAGDEVPITKYARQLVHNLAKEPGYPTDFAAAYGRNVVSKEDNVKAVIGKIELGEGDVAIVYATDAKASTKVTTVDIPEGANVSASYSGAVVGASGHPEAARAFLGWLTSPDGKAILTSSGFFAPAG